MVARRVGHDWVTEHACSAWFAQLDAKYFESDIVVLDLCFPDSKESACSAGDAGSIPGLGRSPGEGIAYPAHFLGLPLWLSW